MQKADDRPTNSSQLDFHFIKSQLFRVVHCDGVWGGITPRGEIHMSTFSERPAIPQRVTMGINPERPDDPAIEVSRSGKSGATREIDIDIVMSIETAKLVHQWLGDKLNEFENLRNAVAAASRRKE